MHSLQCFWVGILFSSLCTTDSQLIHRTKHSSWVVRNTLVTPWFCTFLLCNRKHFHVRIIGEQFRSMLLSNLVVREGFALPKCGTDQPHPLPTQGIPAKSKDLRQRPFGFSKMYCKLEEHKQDSSKSDTTVHNQTLSSAFPLYLVDLCGWVTDENSSCGTWTGNEALGYGW